MPILQIPNAFAMRSIDIWRVEDGRFVEHWDGLNTLDTFIQRPKNEDQAMPVVKLIAVGLPIALGVVMIGAGGVNFAGPSSVRESFARWGYPASFHRVTGGLEVVAGLLLLIPVTSRIGAIGSAIILLAAVATLIQTPAAAGYRVVDMQPDRPGADRDRRLRRRAATLRYECVMKRNIVHPSRPDQQRIGRIRRAVKTVAAAFDDQAQIVLAGEVDGGRDVGGSPGGDSIDARRRRPAVSPAGVLRRPGLVADEERIAQIAQ